MPLLPIEPEPFEDDPEEKVSWKLDPRSSRRQGEFDFSLHMRSAPRVVRIFFLDSPISALVLGLLGCLASNPLIFEFLAAYLTSADISVIFAERFSMLVLTYASCLTLLSSFSPLFKIFALKSARDEFPIIVSFSIPIFIFKTSLFIIY